MRDKNTFMARKKNYGADPTGKRLKPRRPHVQQVSPGIMDRHDQSIAAIDIGNAWWETVPKKWKFQS